MAPKNQRWWLTTDHESLAVHAPADRLYDLVADMPRMGEWSPECSAVEWDDGATGPAAGARFVGHNHTGPRGLIKWSRRGRVLVADPGREFAFVTEEGGRESTVWRYTFEAVDGGTRVTESYEAKSLPLWARVMDVPLNRHKDLMKNMRHTLAQLKTDGERQTLAQLKTEGEKL
jgi:hypothetical protein